MKWWIKLNKNKIKKINPGQSQTAIPRSASPFSYFNLYSTIQFQPPPSPLFFFKCSLILSVNWCSLCVRGEKNLSLSAFFFPSSFLGPVHYFSFLSLSVIGWTEVHRWALKTVSQGLNLVFNAWLQRCHLSSNCSRLPPTLSLIIYWWIKRVGQETGLEKLLIDIKIQCPQPDKHGGARVSPRIVGVAIIFFS